MNNNSSNYCSNSRDELYVGEVPIFENLNNEEFLETIERLAKVENIIQKLVSDGVIQ